MNFLSTKNADRNVVSNPYVNNSLTLWGLHADGSIPYVWRLPTDPIAQFMGKPDAAFLNGSEQVYINIQTAGKQTSWRSSVKIIGYDPTQANVSTVNGDLSNAPVIMAYDHAFGDTTRGYVMYEAGHSHIKSSTSDNAAAIRAFFNFSFFQNIDKAWNFTVTGLSEKQQIKSAQAISLNAIVSSKLPGLNFTYTWTASCAGTFSNASAASTTFTPTTVASNTPCVISIRIVDNCGRTSFESIPVTITPGARPPVAVNDMATINAACGANGQSVTVNVLANDSDPDNDPLTVTSLSGGTGGIWSINNNQVTFDPSDNFTGIATVNYTVCDTTTPTALCATAAVNVTVGAPDVNGCYEGTVFALNSSQWAVSSVNLNGVADHSEAVGEDDYDVDVPETYALLDNNADSVRLDFGSILTLGDSVRINVTTDHTSNSTTINVRYGTTTTNLVNLGNFTSTTTREELSEVRFAIPFGGIRYIRISRASGENARLSSAAVEDWACRIATPIAGVDEVQVREDLPAILFVLNNDISPVGAALSLKEIVNYPKHGFVSVNTNNTITYVTKTDSSRMDTFSYRVCDINGFCSIGQVVVSPVDDACSNGQYRPVAISAPTVYQQEPLIDADIRSSNLTTNYNGNKADNIGKRDQRRYLLQFNLGSIPSNAIIDTAFLRLYCSDARNKVGTYEVRRLTQSWVENQVSWELRSTGPNVNWDTAGGTMGATSYTSITMTNESPRDKYFYNLEGLVTNWVSGVFTNNGLIIRQTNTSVDAQYDFSTRSASSSERPYLRIVYRTPGTCTAIPNRAPLANPDYGTTRSDQVLKILAKANDTDVDGNSITLSSIVGSVTGGSASISGDTIIFTPTLGFTGTASFLYRISDGTLFDTARVEIVCTNAPPVANRDNPAGDSSGVTQVITVLSNDTDPEGQLASALVSIDAQPKNGTASVNGSRQIVYIPNPGFTGNDTLVYRLSEPADACGASFSDTALVVITVLNRFPVPVKDNASTLACVTSTFDLLLNDSDPEGNALSVTAISALSNPSAGSLTNNGDGTVTFTPATGFTGVVSFTYTLTDNGIPVRSRTGEVDITVSTVTNNPPVANIDNETLLMNQTWYLKATDNDTEPDGNILGLPTISTQPKNGTVTVNQINGLIEYVPNYNFFGRDTIVYQLCDSVSNASCVIGLGACDTAMAIFIVLPPNTTNAVNDQNTTWINVAVSGEVMTNDFDIEGDDQFFQAFLTQNLGGALASGSTVSGTDLNGNAVSNAGTLSYNLTTGAYTFTPALNFTGQVNVPYYIIDNGEPQIRDTAYLNIRVMPLPMINSIIANNDENVSYGEPVSGNLLINDWDPQGDVMRTTLLGGNPPNTSFTVSGIDIDGNLISNAGSIVVDSFGAYTFTPQNNFIGQIKLPYEVCDTISSDRACATADLTIDVIRNFNGAENDPPFAGDDFSFTRMNLPVTGNWYGNDSEENDDPVKLEGSATNFLFSAPGSGSTLLADKTTDKGGNIKFYNDGSYVYTPPVNFTGNDQVTYEICDVTAVNPQPLCAEATVYLLVGNPNTVVAINDDFHTFMNVPVSGIVTTNDFDPEGDLFTFGSFLNQSGSGSTITSGATLSGYDSAGNFTANAGTLTFTSTGQFEFTPATGFTGVVHVPYNICDNGVPTACDTAMLSISVEPLSDPSNPNQNFVFALDDDNVSYGNPVSSNLMVNDWDPELDTFSVMSFKYDSDGNGTADATGSFNSSTTLAGVDVNGNPVANAGSFTLSPTGGYTFTPTAGFMGKVNVQYVIQDSVSGALKAYDTANLVIHVYPNNAPYNMPPFAGDDFAVTEMNVEVEGVWASNDYEKDLDSVSVNGSVQKVNLESLNTGTPVLLSTITTHKGGTVKLYNDGTFEYMPPVNYSGPDYAAYRICDVTVIEPQPLCDSATIHLLVNPNVRDYGDLPTETWAPAWNVYRDADGDSIPEGFSPVWLGTKVSSEGRSIESQMANSDMRDDGLIIPKNMDTTNGGGKFIVTLNALNTGTTVYYKMYIDWDMDGTFDSIYSGSAVAKSPVNDTVFVLPPKNANNEYEEDGTFAIRLRASSDPDLITPYGPILNGETEDYVASNVTPVPVTLISFEARAIDTKSLLTWKTASEINNHYFEVQHSTDLANWAAIGQVEGAGNSNEINSYSFIHQNPSLGANYYRLRQVDFDGAFDYTQIRVVFFGSEWMPAVIVYPNPVRDQLQYALPELGVSDVIEIELTDLHGRVIHSENVSDLRGNSISGSVDVSGLSAGPYLLRVNVNDRISVTKVIKY